ncbi:hypothetical protein [Pseudomonas plecoglossicida]|uniref:hypothetical protein n=1 Tax=Pseudomonas plecoglossicida TaxID=70775 RepID=UPI00048D2313|nr:hypothetical protein [Pseudomonas plecoglossicida]GLR36167.1 hypothetical protein GCM10011247_15640 [Pseudomonas plecoglossicida]
MSHYTFEHLQQLRLDAKLHSLDTSRAKIERGTGDVFAVHLPRPMWSISSVTDEKVPSIVECRSAPEAEGTLLSWLLKLTRAERLACRTGRVIGWSPDQITRRPLTDTEISAYRAELQHLKVRDRLAEQLAEALQRQKAQLATQAGVDHLTEQYGLRHNAKPADAGVNALKADPIHEEPATFGATRRPSAARKGARHE